MQSERQTNGVSRRRRTAFTLIELLVVITIISALIAILLPSLSRALDRAKATKTSAILHMIGTGVELYRTENRSDRSDRRTNSYPPSAMAEDPAYEGTQDIAGAHWLVRYLAGKDLRGYANRSTVPADLLNPGDPAEEVQWYELDNTGKPKVSRSGLYVQTNEVLFAKTKDLPKGQSGSDPFSHPCQGYEQLVMTDTFGYPILYYVADPVQASRTSSNIASLDGSTAGIYTHLDNSIFTGCYEGSSEIVPAWDFTGRPGPAASKHDISQFGENPPTTTSVTTKKTFQHYILDKQLYTNTYEAGSSRQPAIRPYRADSFLLVSPGRDGIYGTSDDVKNF